MWRIASKKTNGGRDICLEIDLFQEAIETVFPKLKWGNFDGSISGLSHIALTQLQYVWLKENIVGVWNDTDSIAWVFSQYLYHSYFLLLRHDPSRLYHIEAKTKWPTSTRRHFQMHFLEWKSLNLEYNFNEVCLQVPNWQWYSIGWDNDLVPNRQQAIISTNDGLHWWHICVLRPQWVNHASALTCSQLKGHGV